MIVLFGVAVIGAILAALWRLISLVIDNALMIGLVIGGIVACGALGIFLNWLAYGREGWKIQRKGGQKLFWPIVISGALVGLWGVLTFSWAQAGFPIGDWLSVLMVVGGAGLYVWWFLVIRARVDKWKWTLYGDPRYAPVEKPIKKIKRRTVRMGWHKAMINGIMFVAAAVSVYAGVALIMAALGKNIGFSFLREQIQTMIDTRYAFDTVNFLTRVPGHIAYWVGGVFFVLFGVAVFLCRMALAKYKTSAPTMLTVLQIVACIVPLFYYIWVYSITGVDAIPYTSALVVLVLMIANREYYEKRAILFEK